MLYHHYTTMNCTLDPTSPTTPAGASLEVSPGTGVPWWTKNANNDPRFEDAKRGGWLVESFFRVYIYIVLCYVTLYHIISYHSILYFILFYYIILYYIILYYIKVHYIIL